MDLFITTKPPWIEQHNIEVAPRQLLLSLLYSASLQWPLLWWVILMETKRRGLSLVLGMAMLFHRFTTALLLFPSQYSSWAHAILSLFYMWCTLSYRAPKQSPSEIV